MKINEIKKTVEQIIRTEYIAEDGVIFYNEAECKAYEESALFVISKKVKKLNSKWHLKFLKEQQEKEEILRLVKQ